MPTLQDDYGLEVHYCPVQGVSRYRNDVFVESVLFKAEIIINTIKKNWRDVFVYSDVDVQFFRPTKTILLNAIQNYDIVCQKDDPYGSLCAGFWVARANKRVLKLWENVYKAIRSERRDQNVFNRLLRLSSTSRILNILKSMALPCRFTILPDTFFGGGTLTGKLWEPGIDLSVPEDIALHHANWAIGVENKVAQLQYVRDKVNSRLK